MAGIWAGRTARAPHAAGERDRLPRIVVLDGAKTLGAKILVAGGGRCNVTHDVVDETTFAGSSRHAIRKVLRRFDVPQTVEFFRELDVELKREETGKLFPVTDRARTVLDALLRAARDAGVEILHPWRVDGVETCERRTDQAINKSVPFSDCVINESATIKSVPFSGGATKSPKMGTDLFVVRGASMPTIRAAKVILATGGKSLPKTGSDGHGHDIARHLGHSITPRVFPGLVPLTLPKDLAHYKQKLALDYAELVYNGLWFTPLRESLDGVVAMGLRPCPDRRPSPSSPSPAW